MALDFEVESIDGLDDGVKSLYVEHEGKFRLDVSGVDDGSASKAELARVLAKNEELLGEAKKAKQERRDSNAAAQAAIDAKAQADGDHEQLYKSSQEKLTGTLSELEELKGSIATEKRNTEALKMAAKLADGDNADLLSGFIAQRLKFTDEGLKVTDLNGDLTVSSLADLETEFKNNARYSALLKGNQSSGGGATGGNNSGGAAKTMMRVDFNTLSQKDPIAASKFMREGGQLIDN